MEKQSDNTSKLKRFYTRIFILFLFLSTLLYVGYHLNRKTTSPPPRVLGEKTQKNLAQTSRDMLDNAQSSLQLGALQNDLTRTKDMLLEETLNQINQFTTDTSSSISAALIHESAKPIIEKIQSLPEPQRSQLLKEICK